MNNFQLFINKTRKKISYPNSVIIEPLWHGNLPPLNLVTSEIKAGEILIVEYDKKIPLRVFKIIQDNLIQIYGEPIDYDLKIEFDNIFISKINTIKNYIYDVYNLLNINELINFKDDLECIENEIIKYFLFCKTNLKIDNKKIRSLIFKNCKDSKLSEKLDNLFKKNKIIWEEWNSTKLIVDFENFNVQYE